MYLNKNSMSIRLTEPVIPLRSTPGHTSRCRDRESSPPASVRGLLTLKLAKATKISSIHLELQAKATTHYVQKEGAGPSRIDVTERHKVHSTSTVVFKASPTAQEQRRAISTRPGVRFIEDSAHGSRLGEVGNPHWDVLPEPVTRSASLDPRWVGRRLGSNELEINSGRTPQCSQQSISPAPLYPSSADRQSFFSVDSSPVGRSQSVASSSRFTEPPSSPIRSRGNLTSEFPYGLQTSSSHSMRGVSLSRTSSIEETMEDESESCDSFHASAVRPDGVAYYGLSRLAPESSGRDSERDHRGRSNSRFSFRKVVHVLEAVKDCVRSRSPRARSRAPSEERGRSMTKSQRKTQVSPVPALSQIGIAEPSVADEKNDLSGDSWILFPEGTYTYPVYFTIPNDSQPTITADHGSLVWKVKAEVERPGDDDSEGVEGIDLQQQWEEQLHYRVHIAGRGVHIGGKIPFQLTLTPLAKVKLHSVSAYLDERTEYYTRTQSRARADVIRRATLLVVRHSNSDHRYNIPILPLVSDEPDAFRNSPLYLFLRPGEDESEAASSFMGPGPWTIYHQLSVPDSCSVLHPSNQAKHSNIMVNHTLKLVLRVEKGEVAATGGRKKLYDIVIHVPLQILSCRCTSEWTSLPRYDQALRPEGHSLEVTTACPCRDRHQAKARTRSSHATNTLLPGPEHDTFPLALNLGSSRALDSDSLAGCTQLHEQLMSGLVSETGEAPPSYDCFGGGSS